MTARFSSEAAFACHPGLAPRPAWSGASSGTLRAGRRVLGGPRSLAVPAIWWWTTDLYRRSLCRARSDLALATIIRHNEFRSMHARFPLAVPFTMVAAAAIRARVWRRH